MILRVKIPTAAMKSFIVTVITANAHAADRAKSFLAKFQKHTKSFPNTFHPNNNNYYNYHYLSFVLSRFIPGARKVLHFFA